MQQQFHFFSFSFFTVLNLIYKYHPSRKKHILPLQLIDKTEFVQKDPKRVKWFPLFLVVVIPESGVSRINMHYGEKGARTPKCVEGLSGRQSTSLLERETERSARNVVCCGAKSFEFCEPVQLSRILATYSRYGETRTLNRINRYEENFGYPFGFANLSMTAGKINWATPLHATRIQNLSFNHCDDVALSSQSGRNEDWRLLKETLIQVKYRCWEN